MRFGIVEGEPGIFPEPVARVLRRLARPFRARRAESDHTERPDDERQADDAPDGGETPDR